MNVESIFVCFEETRMITQATSWCMVCVCVCWRQTNKWSDVFLRTQTSCSIRFLFRDFRHSQWQTSISARTTNTFSYVLFLFLWFHVSLQQHAIFQCLTFIMSPAPLWRLVQGKEAAKAHSNSETKKWSKRSLVINGWPFVCLFILCKWIFLCIFPLVPRQRWRLGSKTDTFTHRPNTNLHGQCACVCI